MKSTTSKFSEQYRAALRLRLEQPAGVDASDARALGRQAWDSGIGIGAIARAHSQAVRSLLGSPHVGGNGTADLRRADRFFLAALGPTESGHRVACRQVAREVGIKATCRNAVASLAVAKQRLRSESARAQRAEKALAKTERHYRTLLDQSHRLQDRLRRMARRILTAQEDERKNISRELHDEVAQALAGINVQLAILDQESTVHDRGLRRRIAQAQRFVERSLMAVHRFARELRPALLDDLGLVPALRSFVRGLSGRKSLRIRVLPSDPCEGLDSARRTVLYRVAQEALINVVRHAKATQATLGVKATPAGVTLEVRDNGTAFDVERVLGLTTRKHLGLLGMRERVEMVGGKLEVDSVPGRGTTVRASIPLTKPRRRTTS